MGVTLEEWDRSLDYATDLTEAIVYRTEQTFPVGWLADEAQQVG